MNPKQYSYLDILEFLKSNSQQLVNESKQQLFKTIRKNNRFNPNKFKKKFNFTNWKNSINKEDEVKKNTDDINKEKINLLLNKISKSTFTTMYQNLVTIIDKNTEYLTYTLQQLFRLATSQHIYIALYCSICEKLTEQYGDIIKQSLLKYCKKYYSDYNISTTKKTEYDTDLDLLHRQTKEKEKLIGIFYLVAGLFELNLIDMIVIDKYISLLFNKIKEISTSVDTNVVSLREQYIESLKQFILKVNLKLSDSKNKEIIKKCNYFIDNVDSNTLNKREQFMLMDILDSYDEFENLS